MSVHPYHRAEGTLVSVHPYQLGYVTNDLDAAIDHYGRLLGGSDFVITERILDARMREGRMPLHMRFGLAYLGDITVELIEPLSDETGFYSSLLPTQGFGIALHHLGYLLEPDTDWESFRGAVEPERVAFELSGDPNVFYLDTRAELGHHVEYLQFSQELLEKWQERIPRNG